MANTGAWTNFLENVNRLPVGKETKIGYIVFPHPTREQTKQNPLELEAVDLRCIENTKSHQTATKVMKDANIVLKRGMPFSFDLLLHRDFEPDTDIIKIEFEWGKKDSEIVKVALLLDESNNFESESNGWKGKIISHRNQSINIRVDIPIEIPHGWWNMRIVTNTKEKVVENESSVLVKDIDGKLNFLSNCYAGKCKMMTSLQGVGWGVRSVSKMVQLNYTFLDLFFDI